MIDYDPDQLLYEIKVLKKKVAIFGFSTEGLILYEVLKKKNIPVEYFIDEKKSIIDFNIKKIKIYSLSDLDDQDKNIIIFLGTKYVNSVFEKLKNFNFNHIYDDYKIFKLINDYKDINIPEFNFKIDKEKIYRNIKLYELNSLRENKLRLANKNKINQLVKFQEKLLINNVDIVVTERCSMKCLHCSNMMQYYEKPKNSSFSLLLNSIKKLMSAADKISELRVIGGEPFMNKDISKIINFLLSFNNFDVIIVYTNANIIPKGDNLICLKNPKVKIHITDYSSTGAVNIKKFIPEKLNQFVNVMKENKINFSIEKVINWLDMGMDKLEKYDENPSQLQKKFIECCGNDIFTLLEGKLYKCPVSAHGDNLNFFSSNKDFINFNDDSLNPNNLKDKLKIFYNNDKYVKACSYCKGRSYDNKEIPAGEQTKEVIKYL